MLGLPYVDEVSPLTSRGFCLTYSWLLSFKISILKTGVEMLFLFIFYYPSSLYSTQTIIQTKGKYNENTYEETDTLNPIMERTSLLAY